MPFSYSMSLSVRSGTLFALVKSKGITLMSFNGLGMLGLVSDPGCAPRSGMASRV